MCTFMVAYNTFCQFSLPLNEMLLQLTDVEAIKNCIMECHTRIEMGLHYRIPYPRPIHLPPMGLADKKGRKFKMQERLRKFAKPVYLQSHEEMD